MKTAVALAGHRRRDDLLRYFLASSFLASGAGAGAGAAAGAGAGAAGAAAGAAGFAAGAGAGAGLGFCSWPQAARATAATAANNSDLFMSIP